MHITVTGKLLVLKLQQYPFNGNGEQFTEFATEIQILLDKSVIVKTDLQPGELISHFSLIC